jgi:MarR family transcriptional regulator, lower aerobic nicotinate degradation pathway regulator
MPDIESLATLYRRPGFMVKRLHQVATAIFLEECARCNMTPSQYQALCALQEHPGIGQGALGKLTGQDRSTISLVVRLLLDRGLIRCVVNASDKRSISLKLSEAGVQTLREVAPAAKRAQDRFLSALPEAKRAEFLALLHLLLDRHGEQIDPASVVTGVASARVSRVSKPQRRAGRTKRRSP